MPALSRLCAIALPLLLTACQSEQVLKFSAPTMGSHYSISYVATGSGQSAALQQDVEAILADIDQAVSTYQDDSALARFNAAPPGCMLMPEAAITLAAHAMELAQSSEGAFDITLLPVVVAWGFGPQTATNPAASWSAPGDEQLAALRPVIGMQHLRIEGTALCKDAPIQIDFNSIAAGYAVDRIADYLRARGIANFLIDVTGEMRGEGVKPGGVPWRIGIEAPLEDTRQAQKIIPLSGQSISSSGDYRQYREVDGQRQSHMMDPRTLRPVSHRLASVSVIHASAMAADGLSTLLMVLGPEHGLAYAEQHDIAAAFISRSENGFETRTSRRFAALYPDEN